MCQTKQVDSSTQILHNGIYLSPIISIPQNWDKTPIYFGLLGDMSDN